MSALFFFTLRRLLIMIPLFFVVLTIIFFLIRIAPGGPFDSDRKLPPEILKNIEEKYHLNEPLIQQYFRYVTQIVFHFDLGPSYKHIGRSVNELIFEALPVSVDLAFWALLFALLFGLMIGVWGGIYSQYSGIDFISEAIPMVGVCLPTFVIGPILVIIFSLKLHLFPIAGWSSSSHKVLPALTLGFVYACYIAKLAKAGILDIKNQEFVRVAFSKGLPKDDIIFRHILKGGLLSVVSFLGPAISGLITGALVTETIFNIPGLGRFFSESAINRDYTVVMGTALLYFIVIFICNLLVDISYAFLDPRIRVK